MRAARAKKIRKADAESFKRLVSVGLEQRGGVRASALHEGDPEIRYEVQTRYGKLDVHPSCDPGDMLLTVFARFQDPERSKRMGRHGGYWNCKWNFHMDPPVETAVDHFFAHLDRIKPVPLHPGSCPKGEHPAFESEEFNAECPKCQRDRTMFIDVGPPPTELQDDPLFADLLRNARLLLGLAGTSDAADQRLVREAPAMIEEFIECLAVHAVDAAALEREHKSALEAAVEETLSTAAEQALEVAALAWVVALVHDWGTIKTLLWQAKLRFT